MDKEEKRNLIDKTYMALQNIFKTNTVVVILSPRISLSMQKFLQNNISYSNNCI